MGKTVHLKWGFRRKRDINREIKHNARLIMKCYVEKQGVDYDEVLPPLTRLETVRMLLECTEKWVVGSSFKC